jgi:hypothetical protein
MWLGSWIVGEVPSRDVVTASFFVEEVDEISQVDYPRLKQRGREEARRSLSKFIRESPEHAQFVSQVLAGEVDMLLICEGSIHVPKVAQ